MRDPAGTYSYPPGIEGVPDQTIYSNEYNSFLSDVQQDLNYPRPIVAGGTGARNARDAMVNLSGEIADQVVDNYNSFPFLSGSFYSDNAAGRGAPVDGHAFIGICYMKDDDNIVLEARDESDVTTPGRRYVREKKGAVGAGVWGAWTQDGAVIKDDGSITLPSTPPVAPTDAVNKAYVDTGDAAANANANNRVLRSGDTMSGPLTAPWFSSTANAYYFNGTSNYLAYGGGSFSLNAGLGVNGSLNCGPIVSDGTSNFIDHALVAGAGQPAFAVHNTTAHVAMGFWVDNSGPHCMYFGDTDGNAVPFSNWMSLVAGVGLFVTNNGYKPGGGLWVDSSDARIKNVMGSYTSGLDAVAALSPVRFTFKGNDSETADGESFHQDVATNGTEFIGLIAQDTEAVMPELVSQRDAYIDGVAVTDLRMIDTTPLVYALINSIKELKARIEALEG